MIDIEGLIKIKKEIPELEWDTFLHNEQNLAGYLKGMRIQYWYQRLLQRLDAPVSAYMMELRYERESFKWDSEGRFVSYPGKWKGYETEQHEPKARTLDKVEQLSPGSTRELRHPIWEVLRLDDPNVMKSDAFLYRLDPPTQAVVFKTKLNKDAPYTYRTSIKSRLLLVKLERTPSLDSLACLTWLLREASEKQCESAVDIGRSIHYVLLMLAVELHKLKIGVRLLSLYVARILPLAAPRYHRMHYTAADYLELSCELNLLAVTSFMRNNEERHSRAQFDKRMNDLLSCKYGFNVCFALGPFYALDERAGRIPQRVIERHERQVAIRRWGREHLFNSDIDSRLPPEGTNFS